MLQRFRASRQILKGKAR